jgi:hypothetical protein
MGTIDTKVGGSTTLGTSFVSETSLAVSVAGPSTPLPEPASISIKQGMATGLGIWQALESR